MHVGKRGQIYDEIFLQEESIYYVFPDFNNDFGKLVHFRLLCGKTR